MASSSEKIGVYDANRASFYVIRTVPLAKGLVEALGRICFQGLSKVIAVFIESAGFLSLPTLSNTIFLCSKVGTKFTGKVARDRILYYKSFVFKLLQKGLLLNCFKTNIDLIAPLGVPYIGPPLSQQWFSNLTSHRYAHCRDRRVFFRVMEGEEVLYNFPDLASRPLSHESSSMLSRSLNSLEYSHTANNIS